MPTNPLDNSNTRIDADGTVWRIPAPETRSPSRIPDGAEGIDPVQALIELGETPDPAAAGGLADQLLAWIAPRPRNPATLSQSRLVPLLGLAADLLARASDASREVADLGATALAQELRMQRALTDRRSTLIADDER
jgi:hypothetical protein